MKFAQAEACQLELFSKIYRLENNQALSSRDAVSKTNCSAEVTAKVSQIISNASGVITASFIEKEFPEQTIAISPRKVSLLDLNITFRDQLSSESNLYFLNTQSMNQINALSLAEGEQLKAVCENCNGIGEKNIKVDISNPISGSKRTLWFTSKIFTKIKVLKAKRQLSYTEKNFSPDDFYSDEVLTSMPQNVLTKLDNIHFFKPNKTITEGSIVTTMDLQAVNLITYGTPVKLILKNQNINLSKNALPVRSAQFGEVIEVQTTDNNKKIPGRVVDYNKVVIEL
jgi:flagella basal body P-ring formation protein FlgA